MKTLVVIGSRLAIICTAAALVLALVNAVTAPVIVENKRIALEQGLLSIAEQAPQGNLSVGPAVDASLLSGHDDIENVYQLLDTDGELAAFVVQLVGTGYGGDMMLLAGYELDGTLFAAKLMSNQETPGLGKKAEDPEYMHKFIGFGGTTPIPTSKTQLDAADADAITGATITFMGVSNALAAGSAFVASLDGTVW